LKPHLQLRLTEAGAPKSQTVRYSVSPVRVGRNVLNDLPLSQPEVSQWHGAFDFDDQTVSYTDLGSKNGTRVNGAIIEPNRPVILPPRSQLAIGGVSVEVLGIENRVDHDRGTGDERNRGAEPPTVIGVAWIDAFREGLQAQSSSAGVSAESAVRSSRERAPVVGAKPSVEHPRERTGEQPSEPELGSNRVYHEGLRQVLGPSSGAAASSASGASLASLASHVRTVQADGESLQWLQALVGKENIGPRHAMLTTEQMMARGAALLRAFCQSYIELKRGVQRAELEMGLQHKSAPDSAALTSLRDAEAMLAELFVADADHATQVYELNRAFAEIAVHQVAVLSALMEGSRGLLETLSPEGLRAEVQSEARRSGALGNILPATKGRLWTRFCERYADIVDADGFSRALFGSRFARAYYVFSGRHKQSTNE
jgi:predicted component of type VI protein secretion system